MPLTLADFSDPFEPIYTFVEKATGANVNIASERLRKWTLTVGLETVLVPVSRKMCSTWLEDNIISASRVAELYQRARGGEILAPVLFAKDGQMTDGKDDVMLVDGHHRYFLAALCGCLLPAHVLEVEQWEPFKIVGFPAMDDSTLKALPITRRNY